MEWKYYPNRLGDSWEKSNKKFRMRIYYWNKTYFCQFFDYDGGIMNTVRERSTLGSAKRFLDSYVRNMAKSLSSLVEPS